MKTSGFSIIALLLSCGGTDSLHKVCETQCIALPGEIPEYDLNQFKQMMGVGECHYGVGTCDENYNLIKCEGTVFPSGEICDNLDNDCDGLADDYIYPVHAWDFYEGRYGLEEFPCKSLGGCQDSIVWCNEGTWECSYWGTCAELDDNGNVVENETLCDGCDNDCDGRIDENVFDTMSINDRVCYSGNPVSSAANPPCRAGLLECIHGETICRNEITPSTELCDGIDNDCNGITDDTGDILVENYDVVFIIDTSGSMCEEISAVAGACNAYAAQFDGNPNFRFALVIMSTYSLPYIRVDTNFTDFASIRNRLQTLGCNGGGLEASMDSMYDVCDRISNPLSLSWRPDANGLFFMLTDEPQQTYTTPRTTGQMVIDACIQSGTLPFIWSNYPADFQYIADGANGKHFDLINDWEVIFDDMNSIVVTLCNSGG